MNDHNLDVSMVQTLKADISSLSDDITELLSDISEMGFDSILEEGVLQEIPVVKTVLNVWRVGVGIREVLFLRKLLAFLTDLQAVPMEQRVKMIDKLEKDEDYRGDVGAKLIQLIDRLDSVEKAQYVGRAFRAYCVELIDSDTLGRLNYAIERLYLGDFAKLDNFIDNPEGVNASARQGFLNAGLGHVPPRMGTTAVRAINELCEPMKIYVVHGWFPEQKA